ncbi:hypothetical protein QOZ95_004532 [Paenibacillus brasilensis]|uniref:Uncharacterized protein n=1 Tax=Paenibacillus brasilensis TaxID=128574 RepID=A0ABU0L500_9BACL|nr:hypothetical protein [Paenibacillus brasilensis]
MILVCCSALPPHLTSDIVKSNSDKTAKLLMTSYLDLSHIPHDKLSTVLYDVLAKLRSNRCYPTLFRLTDREVILHDRSESFGNWFAKKYKKVCVIRVLDNEKKGLV